MHINAQGCWHQTNGAVIPTALWSKFGIREEEAYFKNIDRFETRVTDAAARMVVGYAWKLRLCCFRVACNARRKVTKACIFNDAECDVIFLRNQWDQVLRGGKQLPRKAIPEGVEYCDSVDYNTTKSDKY